MAFRQLSILLLVFLIYHVCGGTILLEPKHHIGREGQHAVFTCKSDAIGKPIGWRYSAVGQTDTVKVYHNKSGVEPRFQGKISVNESVIDDWLWSTLVIENPTFADAGILICLDDAPHGSHAYADFSVTQDITCERRYIEDSCWKVQCNTRYRSEVKLELDLNIAGIGIITAKNSRIMDNEEKGGPSYDTDDVIVYRHAGEMNIARLLGNNNKNEGKECKQIESDWYLKVPRDLSISVMLRGDKTLANISSDIMYIATATSIKSRLIKTSIALGVPTALLFISVLLAPLYVWVDKRKRKQAQLEAPVVNKKKTVVKKKETVVKKKKTVVKKQKKMKKIDDVEYVGVDPLPYGIITLEEEILMHRI